MKRLIVLLLILALLIPTSVALAEDETGAITDETSQTAEAKLSIDTQHIYPGMDKSYAQGYMPSVTDGIATVVLPIIASGGAVCDTVTASLDLGDPTVAPFVFKNYASEFLYGKYDVEDGSTSCFLASFSLALRKDRLNGNYPVIVRAEGKTQGGEAITGDFTLYVVIEDGKTAKTETQREPAALPQPKLIVESYECSEETLEAGTQAVLTVTVKNTSASQTVKNLKVSFQDESGEILPAETGSVYVDRIKKRETASCGFDIRVAEYAGARAHVLTVTMEYENSKAAAFSSSDTIVLDVTQPIRLEYEQPSLPAKVTEGDNVLFSMNVMNLGKSTVDNVLLKFEIPGLNNGGSVLAGNIQPGEAKEAKTNLLVSSLDGEYGDTSGTILLSYENETGELFEREIAVKTRIEKKIIPVSNDTQETEKKDESPLPWWIWAVAGVILLGLAGLAAGKVLRSRRQRELDEKSL